MVIHVGIDLITKKISSYDTLNETYIDYVIAAVSVKDIFVKIKEILNEIKATGEFGCACIVKNDLKNFEEEKFYKKLYDYCSLHGFKKCQMIDWRAAELYSALSHSNNYIFANNDFVALCEDAYLFVWQNQNGIFKKIKDICIDPKISLLYNGSLLGYGTALTRGLVRTIIAGGRIDEGTERIVRDGMVNLSEDMADFKKITKEDPKIIFHLREYGVPLIYTICFPTSACKVFDDDTSIGALYKARMMGNDDDVDKYDAESSFGTSVIVKLNEEKIMQIEYGEILPLRKAAVKKLLNTDNILKVVAADRQEKVYTLPLFKRILIMLQIESNKTYSIKCTNISNDLENKIEQLIKKNPITARYHDGNNNTNFDVYNFPVKMQTHNDNITAVGIDLGTTRCCAAVNRKSGIETVALENTGGRLLPSFVSFSEEHPICGQIVFNRMRNFAKSTVFDAKRLIGKTFEEIKINKAWPFEFESLQFLELKLDGKHEPEEKFVLKVKKGDSYLRKFPEEISAILLKHIKTKAEEFQGKELTNAVITIPTAFNELQIQATYDAAIFAGWETVYLLPEPVAAAFAYFIDRPIPNNSTLLLFDLGGGTLDVCIFKIEKNQIFIISKNGDRNLGGRDFDNLLVNHFENILTQTYNIEITDGKRHKLLLKCQNIKESLSVIDKENLDVEDIDPSVDANISISRNEFESISSDLILQIKQNIDAALETINYEPNQIDKVLQVGGGCRMPMIKNLLTEIFPKSEQCAEENPDEVVAIGAAYYSCYLSQKEDKSWCSIM